MAQDPEEDRIRRKAHELWEAEGRPHGRDLDHWDQAREIIAIKDSQASTLLPRDTGAEEPIEPALAIDALGDVPNLTDQGKDPLTDTAREPTFSAAPAAGAPAAEAVKPMPPGKAPMATVASKAKTTGGMGKADSVTSKPIAPATLEPIAATKARKGNKKKR